MTDWSVFTSHLRTAEFLHGKHKFGTSVNKFCGKKPKADRLRSRLAGPRVQSTCFILNSSKIKAGKQPKFIQVMYQIISFIISQLRVASYYARITKEATSSLRVSLNSEISIC